jgi:hypothetical protein
MDIIDVRPIPIELHPVSKRKYLMPTHSIGETYAMVLKVIQRGDSGLVIWGRTRYGKTSAMLYCTHAMHADFPNVPVSIYNVKRETTPKRGNFYTSLMHAVGYEKWDERTSLAIKQARLVNFMAGEANSDGRQIYILFLDEAQRLHQVHYDWIKDLYNDLILEGVTLLPILVGQHDLLDQKVALLKNHSEGEAIVNRFMLYEHPFKGIREKEDFVTCVGYYDTATYPVNSDWTYTRFFLPEAFGSGFRLSSLANMLWDAFYESYTDLGISVRMEIPMKYFTKTMEMLLTESVAMDSPVFGISKDACKRLITESWFLTAAKNAKESKKPVVKS